MAQNGKILLLMITVVAIGIVALPGTIAIFGGQHNWYSLNSGGSGAGGGINDVPCEKCHADIASELHISGPHENLTCAMCHRATSFTDLTYARGNYVTNPATETWSGTTPGVEAHAASTIACMDCHGGVEDNGAHSWEDPEIQASDCNQCHSGGYIDQVTAGGFGLTGDPDLNDTGGKAAHMAFVIDANGSGLMEETNEACIACHTHTAIDINWSHKYRLTFEADDSSGSWEVDNFVAEGTYNVTTYGNMSGETTGASDPVIRWDNGTLVTNP
ncbi:MAG: hypothetical protein SVJ22_03615 [Halobacteriota archaeon]|nr:hypothetical protein [Halobacteriota archaeon]